MTFLNGKFLLESLPPISSYNIIVILYNCYILWFSLWKSWNDVVYLDMMVFCTRYVGVNKITLRCALDLICTSCIIAMLFNIYSNDRFCTKKMEKSLHINFRHFIQFVRPSAWEWIWKGCCMQPHPDQSKLARYSWTRKYFEKVIRCQNSALGSIATQEHSRQGNK